MSELSDLLTALPVPEHRPGFWEELEARLAEIDAEHPAVTSVESVRLTNAKTDDEPSALSRRHRRMGVAVLATAAAIAVAVGMSLMLGDDGDAPTTVTDNPPTTSNLAPITTAPITTAPTPAQTAPTSTEVNEAETPSAARSGTAEETWLPGSAGFAEVFPWQGGFAAFRTLTNPPVASGPGQIESEVWLSPDGNEWQQSSILVFPGASDFTTIRTDGGHLVVRAGEGWYATDDLTNWQELDVSSEVSVVSVLPDGWIGLLPEENSTRATGRIVTADWDGGVVVNDESSRWQAVPFLLGPNGGIGEFFDGLAVTSDWVNWSNVPPPPWGDEGLRMLSRLSDSVVAVAGPIWVGEADGSQWRQVEHPRLDGRRVANSARSGFGSDTEGFVAILDITDYGELPPVDFPFVEADESYPPPEFIVVASRDGERWLVEDIDLSYLAYLTPPSTSISGNRVLVHHRADEAIDVFDLE